MTDKRSEYVSKKLIDSFYEKVAEDVANNIQDKGVWTKAFAKAGGDEQKAKAFYIELMVDELILQQEAIAEDEEEKRLQKIKEINEREQKARDEERRRLEKEEQYQRDLRHAEAEKFANSLTGKIIIWTLAIPFTLFLAYLMTFIGFFGGPY